MKTFNCWLIANVLPYVVAISCYFAIGGLGLRMNCFSFSWVEHDLQTSFKDGLFFIRKEFGRDYLLSENCKKRFR